MLGRVVLGRYEILRSLGHGSMGQVWLARDRATPREVVVKQIHARVAGQPHYRALFAREMQFMARFRHPHAVEYYDGSLDDTAGPCIIMEYVPGVALDALLRKRRLLLPEQVGALLTPLCQALHAAHTSGIIHRDLKPSNLMVTDPDGPRESLKVMDLGLAQLAAKPHIRVEQLRGSTDQHVVGTPAYICPEQLRGDQTDHRGDIYSLGVVLFELLTGRLPFDQDDAQELMMAHVRDRPPTFKEVGLGILPPPVERVVHQCLAKYPNERPQTAYELACRFQAALGRPEELDPQGFQPVSVAPVPALEASARRLPAGEQIVEQMEAVMPEPIAVVKLRGFLEEAGGRVVESVPGLIRVILGEPPPAPKKSGIFDWFRKTNPPAGPLLPPIAVDLHMTKKEGRGPTRLALKVVLRSVAGPLPDDHRWHQRCDKLLTDLRGYLMAAK